MVGSISGFGHDGPEAGRAGYDQIAQGEGGLMSLTGVSEPTKVGVPIADLLAGMNLAYGVLAALHERARTGRGRVVRTSLLAGVVGVHAFQGTRWTIAGEVPGVSGSHHPAIAPYGMFATATSPVQVAVGSEGLWQKFAPAVGLDPADARFATNRERVAHRDALIAEIEAVFATQEAEHWLDLLLTAGRPGGQGALARRRLRLGADAVAGAGRRGRPPGVRVAHPGRLTDPVRGQPVLRWTARAPPAAAARRARRRDQGMGTRRLTAQVAAAPAKVSAAATSVATFQPCGRPSPVWVISTENRVMPMAAPR